MKRNTAVLISLFAILLLAGLCSCKQETEAPSEKKLDPALIEAESISEGASYATLNAGIAGVSIPSWEISSEGYHNISDVVLSGTESGVTKELKAGVKNPPVFSSAKNLIVLVCEGLTSELIETSRSQYGELILDSLPEKGNTYSKFTSSSGVTLSDFIINEQFKNISGIAAWGGETSSNSLRRMTTKDDNNASISKVNYDQFMLNPPLRMIIGKGDFTDGFGADSLNLMYKSSAMDVSTLEEAVSLYKNYNVHFDAGGHYQKEGAVSKLYVIFEDDTTLPSFRQEVAFSLAWLQWKMDMDGFCLMASYCPSSLDANGVQDFDEGVAVAVKYVLENPDTALIVCGCPSDGSEAEVCFFGLGKGVSVKDTAYESVASLY